MKRKLFFCLALIFFLSSRELFCKPQTIKLFVDGIEITNLPTNPIIINDCVLVPVREILEKFNSDLEWRGDAKELLISKNDTHVLLTVNETVAKVNGEEKIHQGEACVDSNGKAYWKRQYPVLFPTVGKCKKNQTLMFRVAPIPALFYLRCQGVNNLFILFCR